MLIGDFVIRGQLFRKPRKSPKGEVHTTCRTKSQKLSQLVGPSDRPKERFICGRMFGAGSGGGLPVLGKPNAPKKRVAFRRESAQIAEQSSARAKRSDRKVARMSHAKRYADKGVANEGWDPKTGKPPPLPAPCRQFGDAAQRW